VLLVAQTTQNEAVFAAIQERFAKRYPQGVIKNTICGSTHERQAEVRALAARVDAMVIVGGFHSGNTVRLAEIARECGVPTFHIETEADLHPEDMGKYAVVGVSAGASTPNWMIRNVVRFLETLEARQRPREIGQLVARAWDFLVKTNVHVALGAGLLTFAAQAITGWQGLPGSSAMAGLYVFAMHTFNRYLDRDAIQFNDPERAAFDRRWQRVFLLLSIGAAAAALGVGAANGAAAFLAMLVLIVFGLLYGVRIFGQGRLPPFSILKLKDIPASKTLLVPIAWACATVLIPQLPHLWSAPGRLFFATGMIFLVMFVRTALFDLQDVQGDRLVGRETIAVFVGEENTRRIVFAGLGLLAVQVLAGATVGLSTSFAHALPPFVAVYAWCVHRCLRNPLKRKNGFANAVEALPAILGLLGLLWGWLAA
jgi:4-hydroxy-3-methylbut-2-enyl diphosphate reductase